MRYVKFIGLVLAALYLATGGIFPWSARAQAASDPGQAMIEEISRLIEAAERDRAADPKFLNDMRQALKDFQAPKFVELMRDDFSDGNFSRNPRWTEFEGEFTVNRANGLHSIAQKIGPSEAEILSQRLKELEARKADKGRYTLVQSSTLPKKPYVPVGEEIERVKAAIKAAQGPSAMQSRLAELEGIRDNSGRFTLVQSMILAGKPTVPVGEEIERTKRAVAKEQAAKAAEQAARERARSALFTRLAISNSFAVQLDMVSRKNDGRFEMDIFQGQRRDAGYRLAYNAGISPSFEILRFGRSGVRLLAAHDEVIKLEDGFRHRLLFSRDDAGAMSLSLDGETLLRISDGSFRNPFVGVTLANEGGDFAVREIKVLGVK